MKKVTRNKLILETQTIRVLTDKDMTKVVGGYNGQTIHKDTGVCADTYRVG